MALPTCLLLWPMCIRRRKTRICESAAVWPFCCRSAAMSRAFYRLCTPFADL